MEEYVTIMVDTKELAVIDAVKSGCTDDYRFLVERYHRGLVQHLYNLMHDGPAAEDAAQEAFIRAYQKLSQYNPAYSFSTWLYRIADTIAYRQLKQTRITKDIDEVEMLIPDTQPSAGEMVDRAYAREAVQAALRTLPPAYQQVVALYYWDDFSYEDIAAIIERPIGTVRTWLYRAKEQLRKELNGQV